MPQTVSEFVDSGKDLIAADIQKRRILAMYRNHMEIDFLAPEKGSLNRKLSPIAVKSTSRYKTTSPDRFKDTYSKKSHAE